jgi:hypothetical protein
MQRTVDSADVAMALTFKRATFAARPKDPSASALSKCSAYIRYHEDLFKWKVGPHYWEKLTTDRYDFCALMDESKGGRGINEKRVGRFIREAILQQYIRDLSVAIDQEMTILRPLQNMFESIKIPDVTLYTKSYIPIVAFEVHSTPYAYTLWIMTLGMHFFNFSLLYW